MPRFPAETLAEVIGHDFPGNVRELQNLVEAALSLAEESVEPELIRVTNPRYPEVARQMRRQASITLRVRVDKEGKVVEAIPQGDPVGFGFEHEARQAALLAVYRPGTPLDGPPTHTTGAKKLE